MRIAVTGAGGFVGAAVLRAAALAGHETVALTRHDIQVVGASRTVRIVGIEVPASVRAALAGADAVVHLAARVHVMRETAPDALNRFRRANVEGTRAVMDACEAMGVRRAVIMSTAKVHGAGRTEPYRESDPCRPQGPYEVSKAEAESVVERYEVSRVGWTILRPPLVYGAGVGGNFLRLLQLVDVGRFLPLPFGGVQNRRSLVHVSNLASAVLSAISEERAVGRRYLVSDGEDISTGELMQRLAAALGRRIRSISAPPAILRTGFAVLGRKSEAERLLESFVVDSTALRTELSWVPPLTLAAGLADVAEWWRREGH